MDMPEGYKKLRKIRFENAEEVELLVCLDLMREMAEGFQFILDQMELVENHPVEVTLEAKERLQKFKEWK